MAPISTPAWAGQISSTLGAWPISRANTSFAGCPRKTAALEFPDQADAHQNAASWRLWHCASCRAASTRPRVGRQSVVAQHGRLPGRKIHHHGTCMPIFGHMGSPKCAGAAGVQRVHRIKMHAIQFQFAGLQRPIPASTSSSSLCPLPEHRRCPRSHLGTVKLTWSSRATPSASRTTDTPARTGLWPNGRIVTLHAPHVHLASHHGLCQPSRCLFDGHFGNHPPLAHHGHLVTKPQSLFQLVRNQQDGGALLAQAAQHAKQLLGFLGSGPLWARPESNLGPTVQGFRISSRWTISHRQIRHQGIQAYMRPGGLHQGFTASAHLVVGAAQQASAARPPASRFPTRSGCPPT